MQIFSSADRQTGETSSDFHVIFTPAKEIAGKKYVFRMLEIANSVYNVSASHILDVSATAVSMTPGSYDGISAASMIQTRINAVMGAGTVAVAADANTAKLVWTFAAPQTIQCLTGASASAANTLWRVLGFTDASGLLPVDSAGAAVIASPYPCRFAEPSALYINVEINGERVAPISIGNSGRTASLIVPLTGGAGDICKLTQDDCELVIAPSDAYMRSARLWVTTESGASVDLFNQDWWVLFAEVSA